MSYKDDLSYKIATYSGSRLVALQYQAIIENLEDIKKTFSSEDINLEKINYLLDKNRDIFANLMINLDEPTEFNIKTKNLYIYFIKQTDLALIHQDMSYIDSIIPLLISTMNAWETVADKDSSFMDKNTEDISVGATYGKTDINVFGSKNQWEG